MFGSGAITLARIKGIRIGVDYSWFFVLFLVIFWLSSFYKDIVGENEELYAYALAVASALLFFTSILLHELGHAFVALRNGIPISSINLWMFGGVAHMERDTDSAGVEFKVAIAGPLVTLVIILVSGAIGTAIAGQEAFKDAMTVDGGADTSGVVALIAWLTSINSLVLIFNLIPAYPLDGGRVARAIAWWRTGDRTWATRFAAMLGQGFSYVFIGIGIFLLIQGDVIGGIWLAVIGFILNQAARASVVQTTVSSRIEGISVADVMDREPVAIPESTTIDKALDEYFLRYRYAWFPVVDGAGHLRGLFQREEAESVPEERRASSTVGDVLASRGETVQVSEDAPLESVLGNPTLRKLGALVAVDDDGRVSGVITIDQVGRALRGALSGLQGSG